jgi:hypothetical protein
MAKVVILAPCFDLATYIWSPYLRGWVSNELKKRGVQPILLWGDDAVKAKYLEAIKDPDVKGTLGVGHGNNDVLTGQNYNVIIRVGDQVTDDLKKQGIAPVSCLVGNSLMPWLVKQGVPCAIGEVTEYIFTAVNVNPKGEDPEEDRLLKHYMYAEYTFWYRLAEGFTAGEAYRMMMREYYRQASLAKQVDDETAFYVQYDADNRKFFGDGNFRLISGTETDILYRVLGVRDPENRQDTITVNGYVTAEDGKIPQGKVQVIVNDQQQEVDVKQDGSFVAVFAFTWDRNVETTYDVQVIYKGDLAHGYLPKYYETTFTMEPTTIPTNLRISGIRTERDGATVTLEVFARLTDNEGDGIPRKEIEVAVGDGELYRAYAETDYYGVSRAEIRKSFPMLQTKAIVIAKFDGDDVYSASEDTKIAEFPPNWDAIKVILGAVAIVSAALAVILSMLLH